MGCEVRTLRFLRGEGRAKYHAAGPTDEARRIAVYEFGGRTTFARRGNRRGRDRSRPSLPAGVETIADSGRPGIFRRIGGVFFHRLDSPEPRRPVPAGLTKHRPASLPWRIFCGMKSSRSTNSPGSDARIFAANTASPPLLKSPVRAHAQSFGFRISQRAARRGRAACFP